MNVLCVDPSEDDRRDTAAALDGAGFDTTTCSSLDEARGVLAADAVSGVVTEYDLPDGTGLELVEYARETHPDVTGVLFTDAGFEAVDTDSFSGTVVEYVDKGTPGARDELVDLLSFSIDNRSQTAYPLPGDEDRRLDAVEAYVDDADALDDSLDRLTRVARALFDVDAATVGFVEANHEQFLACQGTDVDRLDREKTICTYTILDEGPTVITDTREDPRFESNEALETAGIRFYAGAPIRTPDGDAVGVFCLFDDEPRAFPERDRDLLSLLADEVMAGLEMRRRLREATEDDDE
jgi:GAF domain-containing protein